MKIIFGILICLLAAASILAQKSRRAAAPKPGGTAAVISTSTSDDALLIEYQRARTSLYQCHDDFWTAFQKRGDGSSSDTDLKVLTDCRKSKQVTLALVYDEVSRSPGLIERLLSREMDEHYSAARSNTIVPSLRKPDSELNADNQLEMQRLLVLQNLRIIVLLEQLVKKRR